VAGGGYQPNACYTGMQSDSVLEFFVL